jgi:mannose-6-phosphate isomerase-like protein (cupin superfamily)
MSTSPVWRHLGDLKKYAITAQDNVKQIYLAGPDYGCSASVFFEVWEPGASQPPNSHPCSAEMFVILSGKGRAHCDDITTDLVPGDVLVLPAGSVHQVENSSATQRMYAVTVMASDMGAMAGGFAALVTGGLAEDLDELDLNALFSR